MEETSIVSMPTTVGAISESSQPVTETHEQQEQKRKRRGDNDDPNAWYKHRRKRNKRIRNGVHNQDDAADNQVDVQMEHFPFLVHSSDAETTPSTTQADLQYIVQYLGYTPHNLMTVAYYHPEQVPSSTSSASVSTTNNASNNSNDSQPEITKVELRPAVLQLYPLNPYANNNYTNRYDKDARPFQHRKGETLFPFPTLFWMLSPSINSKVAALEETGWIPKLADRLRSQPQYLAQMNAAHQAYAAERWQCLSAEHVQYVEEKKWTSNLRDFGIAGMQNFDAVKCLHTHYAHYLARPAHGNLIGEWVHALLNQQASETAVFSSNNNHHNSSSIIVNPTHSVDVETTDATET